MVNRCRQCREITFDNKLFCSNECKVKYFRIINDAKIKKWTNKGTKDRSQIGLSKLLNEENLKDIVRQTELNIDERINKSKDKILFDFDKLE